MTARASAGNTLAYFGFTDSTNHLIGETTTAPAAGNQTGNPMMRLLGIQEAASGILEPEDVNIPGDDQSQGVITFPSDGLPTFIATYGVGDMQQNARFQQTEVFTIGDMELNVLQPNDPGFLNGCLILQSRSIDKDSGGGGQAIYDFQIFPSVQAYPLGRQTFAGRQAAVYRVKFTTQVATHLPSGVTLNAATHGTTGGPIIEGKSPHPVLMHRFTGNGVETTFTLPKAMASLTNIRAFVNTQELSHGAGITAVVDGTSLVFSSAPASNAKVIVVWGIVP